jgi:hypothetical protein
MTAASACSFLTNTRLLSWSAVLLPAGYDPDRTVSPMHVAGVLLTDGSHVIMPKRAPEQHPRIINDRAQLS